MEISLENLYVDIGAQRVKSLKRLEKPTIGNDDKRKKLQIKEP